MVDPSQLAADYNAGLPDPVLTHPEWGEAVAKWAYYAHDGRLTGYSMVFEHGGARHDATLAMNGAGWAFKPLPTPTPLWNTLALLDAPDAPVLICDDETAALAAIDLVPTHVCLAWHGGRRGVRDADWSPLAGRAVLIWPTSGKPPQAAANAAAKALREVGATVRVLRPPDDAPDGWEASGALEAGWTYEQVRAWFLSRRVGDAHVVRDARGPAPSAVEAEAPEHPAPEPAPLPEEADAEWPFQMLGHDHGAYMYVAKDAGQVISIGGASHSKPSLMQLAPLSFWETTFACKGKEGWDMAANALLRLQHRIGAYDPGRIRGRGAWWDEGRVVLHLGDKMIVDGVETEVRAFRSEYIYEIGPRIRFAIGQPLDAGEAVKLLDLCKMLSWERPISAYLLAGWCALAPICGALQWRPTIFLTGQSSAGKSWCYQNIILPVVGQAGLALAGSTTEPGIRRSLGSDALPVMIDEMEAKDQNGIARVQNIFDLIRYSSSDTGASIAKGASTGGGGVQWFRIRSMFALLAIGSIAKDYADVTRMSTLALKAMSASEIRAGQFEVIKEAQHATLTPEWIDRLHARVASLIPVIRHNAEVFAVAGARAFGARRLGDQIGALLAGAYALTSSHKITPEKAAAWVDAQNWDEEREITVDTDGPSCLARILEYKLVVEGRRGRLDRSVAELIQALRRPTTDEALDPDVALRTLRRWGVTWRSDDPGRIAISNTHTGIAEILHDTPWSANWHRRLKTIEGAELMKMTLRFGDAGSTRCVAVPID